MPKSLLPEALETVPELLVYLRGSLYGCKPSGKRRVRSTAWKRMRVAALWSNFDPMVMDYLRQFGYEETRFDYTPEWEPALAQASLRHFSHSRRTLSQALHKCFREHSTIWGRTSATPTQRDRFQNFMAETGSSKYVFVTQFQPIAGHDVTNKPGTRMLHTRTPCLQVPRFTLLPCWGI